LSGGAGSRLWPLSRANAPKQLVRLIGERTLLQQTALRALDPDLFEPLTVIGAENHRFLVAEQLRQIGVTDATIVLEPVSRNTAAAAAVAALLVSRASPDGLILLMPADHVIDDAEAFCRSVREASASARCGHLTLFGIKPDDAATGYGYIRVGPPLNSAGAARRVAAFVEKPDRETAEAYIATGDYLWNSGIFLLPVQQLLAEFRAHEPDLLAGASEALEKATSDADFLRLEREALARCPAASLDYAIMERTDKAAVVAAGFGWTDVGCWSALWSLAERDEAETAAIGDVLTWATRASYVRSEGPLVATLGIEGLIVVATKDAVLVAGKDYDQDIREIVARVRAKYPRAE
jgi:mannose-1-phosphate guanylyltransferase/mannose-1-phosphate guanylyltransferase/mannose-6-phosphate isomerase